MALHKNRRRASKENLAFVVRKDFNAAMTSEPETITSFLYTVQNHGRIIRHDRKSLLANSDARRQIISYTIRTCESKMSLGIVTHAFWSRMLFLNTLERQEHGFHVGKPIIG